MKQVHEFFFMLMMSSVLDNGKLIGLYDSYNSRSNENRSDTPSNSQTLTQTVSNLTENYKSTEHMIHLSIVPNIGLNTTTSLTYDDLALKKFLVFNGFLVDLTFQIARYTLKYFKQISFTFASISPREAEIILNESFHPSYFKVIIENIAQQIKAPLYNVIDLLDYDNIKLLVMFIYYLNELSCKKDKVYSAIIYVMGEVNQHFYLIESINNLVIKLLEFAEKYQSSSFYENQRKIIYKLLIEWLRWLCKFQILDEASFIKFELYDQSFLKGNMLNLSRVLLTTINNSRKSDQFSNFYDLKLLEMISSLMKIAGLCESNELIDLDPSKLSQTEETPATQQHILPPSTNVPQLSERNEELFIPINNVLYRKQPLTFFTLKQSLRTFIKNMPPAHIVNEFIQNGKLPKEYRTFKQLKLYKFFFDLVIKVNKLVMNVYLFLNYMVLKVLESNVNEINFTLDRDYIDDKFNYLGAEITTAGRRKTNWDKGYKLIIQEIQRACPNFKLLDRASASFIESDVAKQMETAINVHLGHFFKKIFKKYLRICFNLSDREIWLVISNNEYNEDPPNPVIKKYNNIYRQSYNYKKNPNSLLVRLKMLYTIQQFINRIKRQNEENANLFLIIENIYTLLKAENHDQFKTTNSRKNKVLYLEKREQHYVNYLESHNFDKKKLKRDKKTKIDKQPDQFSELSYRDFLANQTALETESQTPQNNSAETTIDSLAAKLKTIVGHRKNYFDNYHLNADDERLIEPYFSLTFNVNLKRDDEDDDSSSDEVAATASQANDVSKQLNLNKLKELKAFVLDALAIKSRYKSLNLFNIIPISKQLKPNYIPIYNTTLTQLMYHLHVNNDFYDKEDVENANKIKKAPPNSQVPRKVEIELARESIMNKYFNRHKMLTVKQQERLKYHGFSTNGKTVSILYESKNIKKTGNKHSTKKNKEFVENITDEERENFMQMDKVAGDPGVSDTIFTFVRSTNKEYSKLENPTAIGNSKKTKIELSDDYYLEGNAYNNLY